MNQILRTDERFWRWIEKRVYDQFYAQKKEFYPLFWPKNSDKKVKKSENQKFDPCDCGDTSEVDLDQFLALENDLVLSFFVFREIPVNRIWNLA